MKQDRIHARKSSHHVDRWSVGTVEAVEERDDHCAVSVRPQDGDPVELVVTLAVRDLFVNRLDADSPVGERSWYRKTGG